MEFSKHHGTPPQQGGVSFQATELGRILDSLQSNGSQLQKAVARIIQEQEDPQSFIEDVCHHGCISGCVSELIYYRQTHEFFDEYYDDIEELRIDFKSTHGTPLDAQGDYKNALSWYAFEITCAEIIRLLTE